MLAASALKLLTEAKGVVAIDRPVGSKESTRLRRYRVDDPYLRFWFRFIEEQVSNISRGRPDLAVDIFGRDWSTWRGKAIEPVVHDAVFRLAGSHPSLATVTQVGSWWDRSNTHEFDLVAADRRGEVVAVGTVKWRARKKVGKDEIAALATARNVIPRAGGARLVAVEASGAKPADLPVDMVFSAADLLAAWPPDQ